MSETTPDTGPGTTEVTEVTEALMQFLYQAPIGLVQTTLDGTITMINAMSAQLLMPLTEAGDLSNLFDVLQRVAPQLRALAEAASWPGGLVCEGLRLPVQAGRQRADGGGMLSLRLLRLQSDMLMASVTDITTEARQERERVASELRDASRIDLLTALPNRSVALECIDAAIARGRHRGEARFAVLFINGDRFNRVNVTLGQTAGDELLRLMAARIGGTLRQRDSIRPAGEDEQIVARLASDQFAVVLEGPHVRRIAAAVAQRLVDALSQPYRIGAVPVHSSASIGVVLCPDDVADTDADAVLQDASLAMREAKRSGGARFCVFEAGMKTRAQRRASLESELRQALLEDQLFVVYQPITHLAGAGVAGVEALLRWQHPQRGVVSPFEFIPVAEETGLIVPLGLHVLNVACRQFAQWRQQLGAQAPQVLSVNLSRAQITQPDLLDAVRLALAASGLEAGCLQLEITESLAAEDPTIQARLHQLKHLGVTLALDDFGTGYSSLSSLHQWPVDVIKIDRSFVSQIDTSAHHRVLVEATMLVARSLGMQTVAEGVETEAQARVLTALRCDKVQGFLYAYPLDAVQATAWLRAQPLQTAQAVAAAGRDTPAPAPLLPPLLPTQLQPQLPLPLPLARATVADLLLRYLDGTDVAVALFDPRERLTYANRRFRRTHCLGPDTAPTWEEIMRAAHHRQCGLLIEADDIDDWLAQVRRRYRLEPRRVFESDFTDGRWMRVTEETAADGWQLCVMKDVTSLKVTEAELRRARDAALIASITDPLTGLPNRRHAFDRLQTLMAQAVELRLPMAVAVIDIDLFKQVNDRYGHGTGDSVLVAFARTLGGLLRQGDMLGRIGGEEFLMVLANGGQIGAERVLAQARAALQDTVLAAGHPELRVNFSAGVAMAQAGDSPDLLWQRADHGLLEAKAAGRGRDLFVPGSDAAAALMERLLRGP